MIGGEDMLSRIEKYKRKPIKKVAMIAGALCLFIGLGGGVKTALADQDVQLLMEKWFLKKQDESLKEIDSAISTERDVLMEQLKDQLNTEMQLAEKQLAEFTAIQKRTRIEALQEYANNIKAEMNIDNSEQQAAIMKNIDIILENAKAQLDGQASNLKLLPIQVPTSSEAVPTPVMIPVPEETETEKEKEKEFIQEPSPVSKPEKVEADTYINETKPAEVVNEIVTADIYSITDWFSMPNIQEVTVEELVIPSDAFSINSTFSDILMNPQAAVAMRSILMGIEKHPQFSQIQYKTIEEMSRVSPSLFNETILFLLNKSLKEIKI